MSNKIVKTVDKENSELKIVVPVEQKVWKEEQEKAFNKLAKSLKLKGYRAGKVPLDLARKTISKPSIWEEAISKLLNVAVAQAAKEIDPKKETILDSPTYSVEKVSDDELEIIFLYPIFPDIKLKDFKNYKIKFENPSEKQIKEKAKEDIDAMLSKGTLLLPKDKDAKIEKGDTIIFDFKGFIDDVAFEGGEAEKFELKIGSKAFIPGFEEQLIDKPNGWKGSINVKFPAEYFKEDMRNKEAKFDIKIHEIKYNDKQKLTEDFIKGLNIKDVANEKQLNEYLEDLAKREIEEKNRMDFMNEFVTKVIKDNEIPAPRTIVLKELQALVKKFEDNLKTQGISKKDYFDMTGYNDETVKNELKNEAEKSVKKSIIYSTLAKQLDIKPTDEDFNRQYQRIAKLYSIDPQMAFDMIKKEQIETPIINELLIDKLILDLNPSVKIDKEKVTFSPKVKKEETKDKKETKDKEN